MQQDAILAPMLGLMLLTFVVWAYMYFLRLGYIVRSQQRVQFATQGGMVGAGFVQKDGAFGSGQRLGLSWRSSSSCEVGASTFGIEF